MGALSSPIRLSSVFVGVIVINLRRSERRRGQNGSLRVVSITTEEFHSFEKPSCTSATLPSHISRF